MIPSKQPTTAHDTVARLMVGNLPYALTSTEFAEALAQHGQLQDAFLARSKTDELKNAGWGIVSVDEPTARRILDATVLVRGRVARIKRARPKAE